MRTKIKQVFVYKRLIKLGCIFVFSLIVLLAFSFAAASGGGSAQSGGSGGSQGSSASGGGSAQGGPSEGLGDTLRTRDRDRVIGQTRDQTKDRVRDRDGKVCEWRERFNRRLQTYKAKGDKDGLNRAFHRIANRYRFSSDEDRDGFVTWALRYRPWAIEEEKRRNV